MSLIDVPIKENNKDEKWNKWQQIHYSAKERTDHCCSKSMK